MTRCSECRVPISEGGMARHYRFAHPWAEYVGELSPAVEYRLIRMADIEPVSWSAVIATLATLLALGLAGRS